MENLSEKASRYAEENVIEVLKEAFAKVYADGYRDGYKNREEDISVDFRDNKTEYVDLGLPSGTLWANDYVKNGDEYLYMIYEKASEMSIPTYEQWTELITQCRWSKINDTYVCLGPNGNSIAFAKTGYLHFENQITDINDSYFWVSDKIEDNEGKTGIVFVTDRLRMKTYKLFIGYKSPIRLVKTK